MSDAMIQGFLRGDKESWKFIYNKFYRKLFFFALKLTSDEMVSQDIVNESFLKITKYTSYVNYKELEALLFRITRNTCFNYLRRIKRERGNVIEYCSLIEDIEEMKDVAAVEQEYAQLIDFICSLIQTQPDKRRKVVECYFIKRMDAKDIAALMEIHLSGVYKHLDAFKDEVRKKTSKGFGSMLFE